MNDQKVSTTEAEKLNRIFFERTTSVKKTVTKHFFEALTRPFKLQRQQQQLILQRKQQHQQYIQHQH